MKRRPLIGITGMQTTVPWGPWQLDSVFLPKDYIKNVENAGGCAVILPPCGCQPDISHLDGLILSGGEDVCPTHYGETPCPDVGQIDDDRDTYELELLKLALDKKLPALGICRGSQLINIALGGTLIQHLPNLEVHRRNLGTFEDSHHPIIIKKGSKLDNIYGKTRFVVPAHHHQGIKKLGKGLVATATADDGLVEGIELATQFCIGVQWHPEQNEGDKLFEALVTAARR